MNKNNVIKDFKNTDNNKINLNSLNKRGSPRRVLRSGNRIYDINSLEEKGLNDINKIMTKESKFNNRLICILFLIIFILLIVIVSVLIYFLLVKGKPFFMEKQNYPNNVIMERNNFYIFFNKYIFSIGQNRSANLIVNDYKYYLPNKELVENFIKVNQVEKMNYIKEKNDCDNFSFILYGNFLEYTYKYNISYAYLFGVIYSYDFNSNLNHLINFFIDDKYTVYCIEPQNDRIDVCENFGYEFYRAMI